MANNKTKEKTKQTPKENEFPEIDEGAGEEGATSDIMQGYSALGAGGETNDGPVKTDIKIEEEDEDKKEFPFHELCERVAEVLRTPPGNKFNCKVKILVQDRSAVIYQGLFSNVWARLRANGNHNIYRHNLQKLLMTHSKTTKFFKNL